MKNPLTSPAYIKELMRRHGFTFSKALGQNFLINGAVPAKIAEAAEIGPDTGVIEIGPGFGTLTWELCRRAKKVVAIELDGRLPAVLRETLRDFDNWTVIEADALQTDMRALIDREFGGGDVALCANLPYYITTPLLLHLLESGAPIRSMTVMIQKEVAGRLCAAPATPEYGAVTLAVQYYAKAQRRFDVAPGSFLPAPKVTSTVITLTPWAEPPVRPADSRLFFSLIRAAFNQRRKTLCNALQNQCGAQFDKTCVRKALQSCGFPETVRGEALSLADFARLSDALTFTDKTKK